MSPTPEFPWYRVGVDLFQYGGKSYLSVYDALSNFPEVEELNDTSSSTVIEKMAAIFARYGIPVEVCSDNGPQFSSREFTLFARKYDFRHITSSPEFPRSNGLAEKGVQVVKRILKKTKETREDFWLGLLSYRSTPLEDGRSPGELLQGRRLRSSLPDFGDQPGLKVQKHVQTEHSRGPLPPLEEGQVVRVKKGWWSKKAKVVAKTRPRSYQVLTEDRRVIRRNRQHLLPTSEPFRPNTPQDDTSDEKTHRNLPSVASPGHQDALGPLSRRSHPPPRRSQRQTRPPTRLHYDCNFNQVP